MAALNETIIKNVEGLKGRGIIPTLAILRMGERPDDLAYERSAVKRCKDLGVMVETVTLKEDATQGDVLFAIREINDDPDIHGALIFRPLPAHIDDDAVCAALNPEKDVDGITAMSLAGVFSGKPMGYPPCTAQACMEILAHYGINPAGKTAVVIGRSLVIGKPVAMMLLKKNATVTICHTKTVDMAAVTQKADIVVAAAGRGAMVDARYVSPHQVIVDVGINFTEDGQMIGDVDYQAVVEKVGAITPVPGGVGGVTTSVLVGNVVKAAAKSR